MSRITQKDIRSARNSFWVAWTVFISIPASLGAWLLTEGLWWVSLVTTIVSVVIAYNVFETWLDRRQFRDDKLVLCQCGHPESWHGMTRMVCWHSDSPIGEYRRLCPCTHYTPRFWQISRRT